MNPQMTSLKLNTEQIGQSLTQYARKAEFTAQRGLVDELFPFLLDASNRMSARAISRFLENEHGVKLSSVTITKALKVPEKHWRAYFDLFLTEAAFIEQETKMSRAEFLLNPKESLEHVVVKMTKQLAIGTSSFNPPLDTAYGIVTKKWFSLSPEAIQAGLPHLKKYLDELNPKPSKRKSKP
jgi:hypothetical protein